MKYTRIELANCAVQAYIPDLAIEGNPLTSVAIWASWTVTTCPSSTTPGN